MNKRDEENTFIEEQHDYAVVDGFEEQQVQQLPNNCDKRVKKYPQKRKGEASKSKTKSKQSSKKQQAILPSANGDNEADRNNPADESQQQQQRTISIYYIQNIPVQCIQEKGGLLQVKIFFLVIPGLIMPIDVTINYFLLEWYVFALHLEPEYASQIPLAFFLFYPQELLVWSLVTYFAVGYLKKTHSQIVAERGYVWKFLLMLAIVVFFQIALMPARHPLHRLSWAFQNFLAFVVVSLMRAHALIPTTENGAALKRIKYILRIIFLALELVFDGLLAGSFSVQHKPVMQLLVLAFSLPEWYIQVRRFLNVHYEVNAVTFVTAIICEVAILTAAALGLENNNEVYFNIVSMSATVVHNLLEACIEIGVLDKIYDRFNQVSREEAHAMYLRQFGITDE